MTSGRRTRRQYLGGVGTAVAATVAGCAGRGRTTHESPTGTGTPTNTPEKPPIHSRYETATVRVETPDGERLGTVTAAVADTPELRYTGLSDTDSLPDERGMLFVFDAVEDHTFVMREMDFGIDIVYADSDGTITTIHHAPAPGPNEKGSEQHYPGRGQYVLEVPLDWTSAHGVGVGDVLALDRPV